MGNYQIFFFFVKTTFKNLKKGLSHALLDDSSNGLS